MKIGRNALTFLAVASLSVGAVFAQDSGSKTSNEATGSKMAGEHSTHSSGKKVGKHVHGHHHKKATKSTASTPAQDTTTKK